MKPQIHIINGPNLNLLGSREPELYGAETLREIEDRLINTGAAQGVKVTCFQSNSEGDLIDDIHKAREMEVDFIIINPAAYTHTSIAIRDALLAVDIPFIEVHITKHDDREDFRKNSFFSDIARSVISGLGVDGYRLALVHAIELLTRFRP